MGDSMPVHLIRATAYGQNGMLTKSAVEYRAALKYSPNDGALHLALADTLYGLRQYHEAIEESQTAQKFSPEDDVIDAELARCYAQLHDRDQTLRSVQLAEQHAQSAKPTAAGQKRTESSVLCLHRTSSELAGG